MKRIQKISVILIAFCLLAAAFPIGGGATAAVQITRQPEDVVVAKLGDYGTTSLEASGDGLTYQWFYKYPANTDFSASSNKTNSLTYQMVSARNGAQVYCVVKDQYGNTEQSNTVTFTVAKALKITRQPENAYVAKLGDSATVSLDAEGEGVTYQWFYKYPSSSDFYASSNKTNSLTYQVVSARNGAQVYCVVKDKYGNSVQSDTVIFSVAPASTLKITRQPENVVVAKLGDSGTTSLEAEGEDVTYQWFYKYPANSDFSASSNRTNSLTYQVVSARNGAQVYCVVKDKYGNSVQSDTVIFSVAPASTLKITRQPENVVVAKLGDSGTTSLEAEGEDLTYQWFYKYPANSDFSASSNRTNSITYQVVSARNGAQVYCVVKDKYGNSVQSDTVTFTVTPANTLKITRQPQNAYVAKLGDSATVSLEAQGDGLTYQWFYKYPANSDFNASSVKTNSITYQVISARNGAQVYCVVKDKNGNSVQSDTVTFSVAKAVEITRQPGNVVVAKLGDSGTTSLEAEGEGLTYQWFYKYPANSDFSASSNRTNSITYQVISARNGAQVYCVVGDMFGNTVQSDTVTFSVGKTVEITRQPEDVVVAKLGDNATVSVEAEGEGVTYRWYYKYPGSADFSASSNRTNTLTYQIVSARNGAQVYCLLTDAYGNTLQSDTVTLRVAKALTITRQPEDVLVNQLGDRATVSVAADGDGVTYQWFFKYSSNNNFSASSNRTDTLTYEIISARNGAQVYCVVKDAFGNAVQSDTVTMFVLAPVSDPEASVVSNTQISLTWTAAAGAAAYDVYAKAGEGEFSLIGTTTGTAFAADGLTPNTVYVFKVLSAAERNGKRFTAAASDEVQAKTYCGETTEHVAGETVHENEALPVSCEAPGSYEAVVYCTVCGVELSREEVEVTLPHTPAEEPVRENEVQPESCTVPGSYDEVLYCTVCGGVISRETKPYIMPHTPGELQYENEIPGNCAEEGSREEFTVCINCGQEISRVTVPTEKDPFTHVGGTVVVNERAGTCVTPGNTGSICCAGCGELFELGQQTAVDPNNHARDDDGNYVTEIKNPRAATCAAAGYEGDVCCAFCHQKLYDGASIPALPHTPVADAAVAGNCGTAGKTAGSHCSVCGQNISGNEVIPATGQHTLTKNLKKNVSNCLQIGYSQTNWHCSVCGKYYADQNATTELSAESVEVRGAHSSSNVVSDAALCTPATCQKAATYYPTCDKCGEILTSKTPFTSGVPVGHNYQVDLNDPAQAPTCSGDGTFYRTCVYCGQRNGQTELVPNSSLGHQFTADKTVISEPTCTSTGIYNYKCIRCDIRSDFVQPIDPANHPENKIVSELSGVVAPTCISTGEYYETTTCSACGKIVARDVYHSVAKLPHKTRAVAAKAPTCTVTGVSAHYECYVCGRLFSDAAGSNQITRDSTVVPATGHRNDGTYTRVYSRQTTCTVDGLYNEVCYCANGCGTVLDTGAQQTETRFNHMKNGVSAVVDVPAASATCTEPAHIAGTRCSLCGQVMSGLTPSGTAMGHDFSIPGNALDNEEAQGFYCRRCNIENPYQLDTFNTLVNSIKRTGTNSYNYTHSVSTFSKSVTASNYNEFKTKGIISLLPDVANQFDEEMRKTETDYSVLETNRWIRSVLYLKNNDSTVSLLKNSDVTSVSVRKQNGLNSNQILGDYPDTYTRGSSTYNLAQFKNKTISGEVISVTVTLRQERYTPSGGVAGVSAGSMTSLQKLTGKDVRTVGAQYGENGVMEEREEDTGYSMVSTMRLKDIVSNASVTYYFAAADYEPIAAVYNTSVVTSQDVSMSIKIGISTGSITVDPYITEQMQDVFLFSGFFPVAQGN